METSTYHEKKTTKIRALKNIFSAGFLAMFLFVLLILFALGISSCKKNSSSDNTTSAAKTNLQLVASDFVSPLLVVEAPDATGRLFVVDQEGTIWIISKEGVKLTAPFINIKSKMVSLSTDYDERGLLGLAFHPDYKTNGKFYLFYTAPPRIGGPVPDGWNNLTRISEFKVSASDINLADAGSERIILEADHPQLNHDGGTLAFGPDGYLYISIGDGGNKDDTGPGHVTDWYAANTGGNAQNIQANLMGKILRIDVNNSSSYSIPVDNPFVGTSAMPEIYAFGFRNPYRFSFDMGGSHQLFVGDAGQSLYEEIDIVDKGGNYGWNVMEGTVCFNTDNDLAIRGSCPSVDSENRLLKSPAIELKNYATGGIATVIVGGYVYRGSKVPTLGGRYIFGIFSVDGMPNAKIYAANAGVSAYDEITLSQSIGQYLKGFGQDQAGEVYLATSSQMGLSGTTGRIYRLVTAP